MNLRVYFLSLCRISSLSSYLSVFSYTNAYSIPYIHPFVYPTHPYIPFPTHPYILSHTHSHMHILVRVDTFPQLNITKYLCILTITPIVLLHLHVNVQVNIANCLRISNNIIPHDTRDAKQRERFHPFTPGILLSYTYHIPPVVSIP